MMNACTIVARNYLAQASALADSFVEANPEGAFTIFAIDLGDERIGSDDPRVRVVGPEGAGLDPDGFHRMAAIYDVVELATAVKPFLLRHLLREGGEPVTYLDPDILVFRPLDGIERLAREHDIVLTPHTSVPLADDGFPPGEVAFLEAGVFNLGFIAVGGGAVPFLDWWAERLSRRCLVATAQHLFVDQKWIDLVPCYFRHHVLRDPAVNVAYWNLPVRTLEQRDGGWLVDGEPLVFFHFSGYDPAKPHLLSKYQGPNPRIRLDEHPALKAICDMYAARLEERGHAALRRSGYGFAELPSGMPLDARTRAVYRRSLVACETAGAEPPPNPFAAGGDGAFIDWLASPAGDPADWGGLSVLGASAWITEPGVRDAFPRVPGPDADRLLEWLEEGGARQLGMATWLCRGRVGGGAVPAPR